MIVHYLLNHQLITFLFHFSFQSCNFSLRTFISFRMSFTHYLKKISCVFDYQKKEFQILWLILTLFTMHPHHINFSSLLY